MHPITATLVDSTAAVNPCSAQLSWCLTQAPQAPLLSDNPTNGCS
jgi:hypothetical protein